jgi:4a-hydroxytetrahydrobiopterin dehydratase
MARNAQPLPQDAIDALLAELPDWSVENGLLHKTFTFENFSEALAWMVRVALEAEKLDHHPDWCNSWNRVHVHLITHSIDALSELDAKLAKKMEQLAA